VQAEPTDSVLTLLQLVKGHHDGTLAVRSSCNHGVCGSDAMRINGRNRLACKTLVREVGADITVAPVAGLPVVRDLVVDQESFFAQVRAVRPYLIARDPPPERERIQTPAERARYADSTKCILCGACTTACPSWLSNDLFIGPAAVVQAHRFLFDSRDEATEERLAIVGRPSGVWRCRTIFNCTDACPRGIEVTRRIGEVKLACLYGRVPG
jgi:succinate dehydrogenase / fumarate reductase iron-sulfur subunit